MHYQVLHSNVKVVCILDEEALYSTCRHLRDATPREVNSISQNSLRGTGTASSIITTLMLTFEGFFIKTVHILAISSVCLLLVSSIIYIYYSDCVMSTYRHFHIIILRGLCSATCLPAFYLCIYLFEIRATVTTRGRSPPCSGKCHW